MSEQKLLRPDAETEKDIRLDRMRYTKNTASSRLCLCAIALDVLYFISIYKSDVGNYYYTALIGGSIIYNLVFMLATFLCSEGVKSYKPSYSWACLVLAAIQIARIFILPAGAHAALVNDVPVMGDAQFIRVVIYLALSALCLVPAAIINLTKSKALAARAAAAGA